ncbi:hypothetical protein IJ117_00350 [Candidatus Saccharibacteria bacterium]|nr:hypothetical protein [Candidatus Saccharibacteria bacterium]
MLEIFTGDDRVRAMHEIVKILGKDHETIDAADLTPSDLPTIFQGASLLASTRNILIRDFTTNKAVYAELPKYLGTPHHIILLESKLDKRSATYKEIKDQVIVREFKLPENTNFTIVFDIYRTAKRDGVKAVKMLETIKSTEDPIKFTGLLVSQAIKDFSANPQGTRERRILSDLAKMDLEQKTTGIDPWLLVESFLLRISRR